VKIEHQDEQTDESKSSGLKKTAPLEIIFCAGNLLKIYHIRTARYHQHMAVIHISEADAARDFASLMARVREGSEVVIENGARAIAIVRPADTRPGRLLSESIAAAEARDSKVTLDKDFGRDLKDIIDNHLEPLNPPEWD
jgi:antitoxin (DNA-binding transcriptional repressor) of toxin-antitoxin stability system